MIKKYHSTDIYITTMQPTKCVISFINIYKNSSNEQQSD
jgi:hypothetical protein